MSDRANYFVVDHADMLDSVLLPNGRYLIVSLDGSRPTGAEGFNQHIGFDSWFNYATPTWGIQIELAPTRYVMVVTLRICYNIMRPSVIHTDITAHLKLPPRPYTAEALLYPVRRVVPLLEQWLRDYAPEWEGPDNDMEEYHDIRS